MYKFVRRRPPVGTAWTVIRLDFYGSRPAGATTTIEMHARGQLFAEAKLRDTEGALAEFLIDHWQHRWPLHEADLRGWATLAGVQITAWRAWERRWIDDLDW